jgi:ATP-dependent Zn protease
MTAAPCGTRPCGHYTKRLLIVRNFAVATTEKAEGEPNWRSILTHEAGHAIAALALTGAAANIRLRGAGAGKPAYRASYDLPDYEHGWNPNPTEPLTRVMIYAAGAAAEAVLLSVSQSAGFTGDLGKINQVRERLSRDADTAWLSSLSLPPEAHARAISAAPIAAKQLAEVEAEISSGFAGTQSLLQAHRAALQSLSDHALERVQEIECIDGVILVTCTEVQSIWKS